MTKQEWLALHIYYFNRHMQLVTSSEGTDAYYYMVFTLLMGKLIGHLNYDKD